MSKILRDALAEIRRECDAFEFFSMMDSSGYCLNIKAGWTKATIKVYHDCIVVEAKEHEEAEVFMFGDTTFSPHLTLEMLDNIKDYLQRIKR